MAFTLWLLGILGIIEVGGLIFTLCHPDFQCGGQPNKVRK